MHVTLVRIAARVICSQLVDEAGSAAPRTSNSGDVIELDIETADRDIMRLDRVNDVRDYAVFGALQIKLCSRLSVNGLCDSWRES